MKLKIKPKALKNKDLHELYDALCDEYARRFCKKHDFNVKDMYWIGKEGRKEIIDVCGYTISLSDVIIDIREGFNERVFWDYQDFLFDYQNENNTLDSVPNYEHFGKYLFKEEPLNPEPEKSTNNP